MALSRLPTTEMVALVQTWVDSGHPDYQILQARPATAGLLPELEQVYLDAVHMQNKLASELRLRDIIAAQNVWDHRHDNIVRALWYRLLSEEALTDDPTRAAVFRALRERLLPDGLNTVRLSYRQEVGHAQMAASRLTSADSDLLATLTTDDGDLSTAVQAWFSTADQIGQLDRERSDLEGGRTARGVNLKIRRRWIRLLSLIRQIALLYPEDAELASLLAHVDRAEEQAENRAERPPDETGDETGDEIADETADEIADETADAEATEPGSPDEPGESAGLAADAPQASGLLDRVDAGIDAGIDADVAAVAAE